jgi:flagellar basal body-associated protein FliL
MRGKLKFIVPLVILIGLGGVYKEVLAKPTAQAKPHINGTVYVLQKEFLLNLTDGHFAKVDAALVLAPDVVLPSGEGSAPPPDGYGGLPQEAAVRDVITDEITGASSADLVNPRKREALKLKILKQIRAQTDVHVTKVLFTDIAVQ